MFVLYSFLWHLVLILSEQFLCTLPLLYELQPCLALTVQDSLTCTTLETLLLRRDKTNHLFSNHVTRRLDANSYFRLRKHIFTFKILA